MVISHEDEILFQNLENARIGYYQNGNSSLSDEEYDQVYDSLKLKYPDHLYFHKVGSVEKGEHWKKINHGIYKMGSLNKVNTYEEFIDWYNKQNEKEMVVEEKLDGISIRLYYENGILIEAVTRGNGEIGENIVRNVQYMKGIPDGKIDYRDSLIIRAEIIMTHDDFKKLPSELSMKNPRNATTGIAKRLDSIYAKYLTVVCTSIMNKDEMSRSDANKFLQDLGFEVVNQYLAKSIGDANLVYLEYGVNEKREKLNYDIDGLVIKCDHIVQEKEDDWSHPKTQIAWKFPNQYKATYLREVIWQYKGNRISPVGIVDPIELGGAIVSRVSLNNIEYINELSLKINSKVLMARNNDVIPNIHEVLEDGDTKIKMPNICPVCRSDVIRDGKFLYCDNEECSSKVVRKIITWLEAHDSKGVAESTIESLFEVQMFPDLPTFLDYELWIDNVKHLDGFGERKAEIIKQEILKTLKTDILRFMDGLDFEDQGIKRWKAILDYKGSCTISEFLYFIGHNDLTVITGIAEETQFKIRNSYQKNLNLILNLLEIIEVEDYKVKEESNMNSKLSRKSFVFTGALETMKRPEAQKLVEDNGGINKSGVSAGLDFLVTNEISNSKKSQDAIKFGTKIINEKEFLEMLK